MIESIFTFFTLGAFGFWLLVTFLSVVFIATVENEHYTFPTIALIGFCVAYAKPLWLLISWQYLLVGVLVYGLIGGIWSVIRWYRRVKKITESYQKEYGNSLSAAQLRELRSELKVSNNKSKIIGWITYWPWSLVWNITGDFFTMLYESLQQTYQRISDKAIGDFKLKEEPKREEDLNPSRRGY